MASRIYSLRPLFKLLPTVRRPAKRVGFIEKIFWTGLVLILYLIMCEIPLYGLPISPRGAPDPFYLYRVIFASERGTLMELGIGPIVTAGLILQLLVGARLIGLDFSKPEDRALFTSMNKFLAVIMTAAHAIAFLFRPEIAATLTFMSALFIFLQLILAGTLLILMDELLEKGWGIGSAISLFIAAGVAKSIWWLSFSPHSSFEVGKCDGAILAFFQGIMGGENITTSFFRTWPPTDLPPSMFGLILTILIFGIVLYIEGIRIEIPVSPAQFRGVRARYPIKLLYASVIPPIFAYALLANINYFSLILQQRLGLENPWLNYLCQYEVRENRFTLVGGLLYYLTPPIGGISGIMQEPIRACTYMLFFIFLCIVFSVTWVTVGGLDSGSVARQLIRAGIQIPGFRRSERSIRTILDRYIPTITILSGLVMGLLISSTELLGIFGTGIGVLLTAEILYSYYEMLLREKVKELYTGLPF
jgi:preprotein translocase SecY subunit